MTDSERREWLERAYRLACDVSRVCKEKCGKRGGIPLQTMKAAEEVSQILEVLTLPETPPDAHPAEASASTSTCISIPVCRYMPGDSFCSGHGVALVDGVCPHAPPSPFGGGHLIGKFTI